MTKPLVTVDSGFYVKIGAVVAIFAITMFGGFVPLRLRGFKKLLAVGNAFSGGIFLAAGLVHMLPDAIELFNNRLGGLDGWYADFPWAPALAAIGVILVMFMESIAHDLGGAAGAAAMPHSHAIGGDGHGHGHGGPDAGGADGVAGGVGGDVPAAMYGTVQKELPTKGEAEGAPLLGGATALRMHGAAQSGGTGPSGRRLVRTHSYDGGAAALLAEVDDAAAGHAGDHKTSFAKHLLAYVLFLALSVHATIAGLALGMQTNWRGILALLVAILAHKWFEAFALGTSCVKAGMTWKRMAAVVIAQGLCTPVGIIVGDITVIVMEDNPIVEVIEAVVQSLAAGTFIFISLEEVIGEELREGTRQTLISLSAALGCLLMSLLAIWI